MPGSERKDRSQRFRMDLVIKQVVKIDEENRVAHLMLEPDPRRYLETTTDGEKGYLDKYTNDFIPESALAEMMQKSAGTPIFHTPPNIKDSVTYAKERLTAIETERNDGVFVPPKEQPSQHREIRDPVHRKPMTFISVDIEGSTRLRRQFEDKFDEALQIIIRELGTLIGQFHGSILKLTGDGFIAYLDYPSVNEQADNAVDLALSLIVAMREAINPTIVANGLPEIKIRIGAELGDADIRRLDVPTTGFSELDIFSDALNRAVKIQECGRAGNVTIGEEIYGLLHVAWLERAVLTDISIGDEIGVSGYRIYQIGC